MNPTDLPPVPIGLQTLLRAAAFDKALLERVVAGRGAAAQDAGFTLSASERAILEATSEDQLRQMAAASLPEGAPLEGPGSPTRPDEREPTTGILVGDKAKKEPERREAVMTRMGIEADIPRPARNMVTRGIISEQHPPRRRKIGAVIVFVIGAIAILAFQILRLADRESPRAVEGRIFAQGRSDRDCLTEAMQRIGTCQDCQGPGAEFFEACARAASPTPGLCVGVPTERDSDRADWIAERCRGLDLRRKPACSSVHAAVHARCLSDRWGGTK